MVQKFLKKARISGMDPVDSTASSNFHRSILFTLDLTRRPLVLASKSKKANLPSSLLRSSLSAPRLAPWRSRRNELIYILATPLLSALHLGAGERKHMCARSGGGRASVRAVCVCGCGSYPEGAAPKVQGLDARCRWRELKPKHARAGPYTRARKGSRTGALPFDFPPLGSASAPLNRQ